MRPAAPLVPVTALGPDASCCNRANWRCDLLSPVAAGPLAGGLARRGYGARGMAGVLHLFRHPQKGEIAWVVATGRLQIRVDLATGIEKRARQAGRLYADLLAALREALAADLAGHQGG